MNESLFSSGSTDVQRAGDRRARLPDPPGQPMGDKTAEAAAGMVEQAAQGAHTTIDRVADKAASAARQLGKTASDAEHTLHEKTDQLRETRDEWVEGVRSTVRNRPLICIAAAFALGAVMARLTR